MTIHDQMSKGMSSAGRQLEQVFKGLREEDADVKVAPVAMSARETLEHLIDCYSNTPTAVDGKEPQWGSFVVEDKSLENLLKLCGDLRRQAIDKVLTAGDDKVGDLAQDYLILHDAYHVGQLSLIRIQNDSSWDPYSIYE